MPKSRPEILKEAQHFYESRGYGHLPEPLTPEVLAKDSKFTTFHTKYERAYGYYAKSFPDALITSHLNGIDFNQPVELVIIPAGQKHLQIQVAWGAKGSYYSTSEHGPEALGISDKGKAFHPQIVPGWKQAEHTEKQEKIITQSSRTLGHLTDAFPRLPSEL